MAGRAVSRALTAAVLAKARHSFSTASREAASSAMRAVVRRQACRTVVWSRPPNSRPIAGSDSPVSSRARYMATCRGQATRAMRAVDERSSSGERPKCSQAAAWISAIVRLRARRTGAARVEAVEDLPAELGGQRPAGQRAEGDDADQRSLERADVVRRRARRSPRARASSASSMSSCWARLRRIARRVARSGGLMSATSPASKRSRRRSSSACRSRGGRSEVSTIWRPRVVEGVERVEELLLGLRLALEELDVVDEQHVDVAEAGLEALGAARRRARRGTRW